MNQYQSAITSVCSILEKYDSDGNINAYGFGGKPQFPQLSLNQVSHFFPCSGDYNNPAGRGVKGVFDLYNYAIQHVQLSGPTYFAPLLDESIKYTEARLQQGADNYTTVLILTDGCIHDMSETISKIVYGSTLPLSIIIVGVGDANFSAMEQLDGDDVVLRDSRGFPVKRDIVQFVPYRQFIGRPIEALAQEVLRELPGQVESYYKMINKPPNPPVEIDANAFIQVQQNVGANLLKNVMPRGGNQNSTPSQPPIQNNENEAVTTFNMTPTQSGNLASMKPTNTLGNPKSNN